MHQMAIKKMIEKQIIDSKISQASQNKKKEESQKLKSKKSSVGMQPQEPKPPQKRTSKIETGQLSNRSKKSH